MATESVSFEDSQLDSASYYTEVEELRIVFTNYSAYVYFDVPMGVWEDLRDSDDPGDFFRQCIKGRYDYRRL